MTGTSDFHFKLEVSSLILKMLILSLPDTLFLCIFSHYFNIFSYAYFRILHYSFDPCLLHNKKLEVAGIIDAGREVL